MLTDEIQSQSFSSRPHRVSKIAIERSDNKKKAAPRSAFNIRHETQIQKLFRERARLTAECNKRLRSHEEELSYEPEVARLNNKIQAIEVSLAMMSPSSPQDAALQLQVALEGICEGDGTKADDTPTTDDLTGDFDATYIHIVRQMITYLKGLGTPEGALTDNTGLVAAGKAMQFTPSSAPIDDPILPIAVEFAKTNKKADALQDLELENDKDHGRHCHAPAFYKSAWEHMVDVQEALADTITTMKATTLDGALAQLQQLKAIINRIEDVEMDDDELSHILRKAQRLIFSICDVMVANTTIAAQLDLQRQFNVSGNPWLTAEEQMDWADKAIEKEAAKTIEKEAA